MSGVPDGPEKRFAVDIMLGKLAKWLRVLGFDARIVAFTDRGRVESFLSEGLIPVTRREKLKNIKGVVFIAGDRHFEQLRELILMLGLDEHSSDLFSRCTVCNIKLRPIPKDEAFGVVPDFVFETVSDFRACPECGRIYWAGSHKGRMLEKLASLTERNHSQENEG